MGEIICGIYKITSPSGKIYVGQSRDIIKRKKTYKSCNCRKQRKLYNSLKKYGWSNHIFEIVHLCKIIISQTELDSLEVYYEQKYSASDSKSGLNLRKCGKTRGIHSEESKRLMKDNHWSRKDKSEDIKKKIGDGKKGKPTWSKGIPFTELHKTNLSNSQKGKKGRPLTEKQKQHLSKKNTGKKRSQETKDRISSSNKIAYYDPKLREACRLRNIGKKRSQKSIKKQKDSRINSAIGSSKYLGVSMNKFYKSGKEYRYWLVAIYNNGKRVTPKRFHFTKQGELDAAKYYNELAIKHHGNFASLNIL